MSQTPAAPVIYTNGESRTVNSNVEANTQNHQHQNRSRYHTVLDGYTAHFWEIFFFMMLAAGIVGLFLSGWRSQYGCEHEIWKPVIVMTSLMIATAWFARKLWVDCCVYHHAFTIDLSLFTLFYLAMYVSTIVADCYIFSVKPRKHVHCDEKLYWYAFIIGILNLLGGLYVLPIIAYSSKRITNHTTARR